MEYELEGKSIITLEYKDGNKSSLIKTDISLALPKEFNEDMYYEKDGLPNFNGTKALTQCFIQGLVSNIHYGHQKGIWDSAEHLRYIIKELERGFIENVDVTKITNA